VASPRTMTINPLETEAVTISGSVIKPKAIDLARLYPVDATYVASYIGRHRDVFPALSSEQIIEYFENSGFRDDLCLLVIPSDDHFQPLGAAVQVDFSYERPRACAISADEAMKQYDNWPSDGRKRVKGLWVRAESLSQVITNRMPFEDLLIGFQCRVQRKPDIYNSDFWYHFSSVYVGPEHLRGVERCDGCARIVHDINRVFETA
jgi:CMP-N-acetylneuraminate monooxygenase